MDNPPSNQQQKNLLLKQEEDLWLTQQITRKKLGDLVRFRNKILLQAMENAALPAESSKQMAFYLLLKANAVTETIKQLDSNYVETNATPS